MALPEDVPIGVPETAEKPSDQFVFEDKDIQDSTPVRSFSKSAESRIRVTTKNAIQAYLERYLSEDGVWRKQLQLTAPIAVNYITNISGNTLQDPTIYNVQLSRMWRDVRQKSIGIVIADAGFQQQSRGLGGQDRQIRVSPTHVMQVAPQLATVSLNIMVVSSDETTTGDIADVLIHIFGPLTALNKGWLIRSIIPGENWEVRLPMMGPQPTGLERRNINEDQKDSLWSTSMTLDVEFEGSIRFMVENPLIPSFVQEAVRATGQSPPPRALSVGCTRPHKPIDDAYVLYSVPESIPLRTPFALDVKMLPYFARIRSDNPKVAVVDEKFVIHPRRPGTFKLVLETSRTSHDPPPSDTPVTSDARNGQRVVESHVITVKA
jgi:hypothetical protein